MVAHRKAKANCFFEKIFLTALKFAKIAQRLLRNKGNLRENLQANSGFECKDSLNGKFRFLPKDLTPRRTDSQINQQIQNHAFTHGRLSVSGFKR